MKKLLYILILSILFLSDSFAQEKRISVTLDSTKILIGQPLILHVSASFPAQDSLVWPVFSDSIGSLEILQQSNIAKGFDPNNITTKIIQQNIVITAFDSGFYPIPPISFQFNDTIIESEALLVQVQTMTVDTSKGIYDIKEPYQVPFNLLSWIKAHKYWVGGAITLIAILIATLLWFKYRKPKEQIVLAPKKPKIPAHKIALKKLKDIEHQKLWQHNKVKQYHSSVSEIIREYLELRFNILALEATTPEIMQAVQSLSISGSEREKLHQILSLSDLVKFAKATPIATENELCLKNAIAFVESTILKENKTNG